MAGLAKPLLKPNSSFFGSGPCKKIPGWKGALLEKRALLGRSHRSTEGVERIRLLLEKSRHLLGIPDDYLIALVPGSDTGAFEMGLWNLLGSRPVDVVSWDIFGDQWVQDIHNLQVKQVQCYQSSYGMLPLIEKVNSDHDIVFTWNGTTTGVWLPDGNWIADNRQGLTFCDATSAVFATPLPWEKLDITTYSWQKVLGGEAGHGMIILSPRAKERLDNFTPDWAIPKVLQLKYPGVFEGLTINTPSMLCIEDCLMALEWAEQQRGLNGLIQRTKANFGVIKEWVDQSHWITWACNDPLWRAQTSVCLRLKSVENIEISAPQQWEIIGQLSRLMADQGVAFDISNHKKSFPGVRIWAGPTVETKDLERLLPWLDWGYQQLFL